MPENGFSDLPIQYGSTNKPSASLNSSCVSFAFALLKVYCGRGAEEKWGSEGLPPEKFLRTTPYRTSENALLEHRVKVAIIRNLRSLKDN